MGSSRVARSGTPRPIILAAVAWGCLSMLGAGVGFLRTGQTRPDAQNKLAGGSLTSAPSLRPQGQPPKSEVPREALPPDALDDASTLFTAAGFGGAALQFVVALIPAVIVEILVLKPVQEFLEKIDVKPPKASRDYVAGSDDSIKVQRAFDYAAWEVQRKNPDRYWQILAATLGSSTMLARLQGPLFVLNLIAAGVLFYSSYLVPAGLPAFTLPVLPFTISSFALGLLVTFRVNTSTNRYVLARNKWGDILNIMRDLCQQANLWSPNKELAIDFARWVPTFALTLMCHLRDPRSHDLAAEIRNAAGPEGEGREGAGRGLSEAEIQEILDRPAGMNAPHFVLHRMRAKMNALEIAPNKRLLMEYNITRLVDDLGACENIFATPIPLGYTKHTTRFLFLWLALLPLALQTQLGFGIVFAQQLLAFGLLGVEDIGIQIEEPFAVLPLKRITGKIALEAQVVRRSMAVLDIDKRLSSAPTSAPKVLEPVASAAVAAPAAPAIVSEPAEEGLPAVMDLSTISSAAQPRGAELKAWLEEQKLSKYYDALVAQGYDELEFLRDAPPNDIEDLIKAVDMPFGHAKHFKRALDEVRVFGGPAIEARRQQLEALAASL